MKKIQALFKGANHGNLKIPGYVISLFSILVNETDNKRIEENGFLYMIYALDKKIYIKLEDTEEEIEDAVFNEPLFKPHDPIELTKNEISNVDGVVKSEVGTFYLNKFILDYTIKDKIPYIHKPFNVKALTSAASPLVVSNKKKLEGNQIHVSDWLDIVDATQFISVLTSVIVISATPKNLTPPDGHEKKRKSLLKKYEGKLNDPVEEKKYEDELIAIDDEWLKDDPSNGVFMSGAVKSKGRKKMQLSVGSNETFNLERTSFLHTSLEEGIPSDPDVLIERFNSSRSGSEGRGNLTILGGVLNKLLNSALGDIELVPNSDCKSKLYETIYPIKGDDRWIGMNRVSGSDIVPITEEYLNANIDKPIRIRTPLYCKQGEIRICSICAGEALSSDPDGLALRVLEIGSIMLMIFMRAIHGTVLETSNITLKSILR